MVVLAPIEAVIVRSVGLFDYDWYNRQFCGGKTDGLKRRLPLIHYLLVGRKKGLSPNPFFVGEYFDRWRWNQSIVDPLLKYVLRRRTWGQPTSLLFDGKKSGLTSKLVPPLAVYLRRLKQNGDAPIYLDDSFHFEFNKRWSDLKESLYADVAARKQQHEARKVAEPVNRFDFELQKQTLNRYANYFDNRSQPLVSIVMPAWNRQDLIRLAIESVIAQTYQKWELLVVDDGSTDNTVDVVRGYVSKDSRVKIFTPGRGGVCKARNHGIEKANGKWVAFLDSDNEWTPDYLFGSIASLEEKNANVAYSAIEMNNKGNIRYRTTTPSPELLETGNFVDLNALVVRAKTLDKIGYFDEDLRRMVDYDLVIRLSKDTDFIYVPIVGVKYTDHEDLARITTTESLSWDGVVKSKNFIDWESKAGQESNEAVSVILPVRGAIAPAVNAIKSLIACHDDIDDFDVEVIVADASSSSALNITMSAAAQLDDRISYIREPAARDTVLATNYAFRAAKGSKIVILNQQTVVQSGWLKPLLDYINGNTIVGSLQLHPNRTIGSMGVEFCGEDAWPMNILENHPVSDISRLDSTNSVDALTSGCVAIDARTFAKLHGLNPLYDKGFEIQDLCLRASEAGVATCTVVKHSVVINSDQETGRRLAGKKQFVSDWRDVAKRKESSLWRLAGFRVVDHEVIAENNSYELRPKLEVIEKKAGELRWAIKISSPADERRHVWGDTHYAEALAKSLTKLGQRVAIDYHDYHSRPTSYLDDVVLDLRGLDNTQPQEGALNIMWVISHPEKVTSEIVNGFDMVFAAGKKWADYMADQSGKQIEYLPQCTDPEVFHPTSPDKRFAGRVIFVGNSRNVLRPVVRDAITAGIDIDVYGGGWDDLVDPKYVKGAFIPNEELAIAYSSAVAVLNDHWDDMREWGFISNRIFDVLASGSPVISDNVYGLSETLQSPLLDTYQGPDDISDILRRIATNKNSKSKRGETVDYIRENHSFDARARRLHKVVKDYVSQNEISR